MIKTEQNENFPQFIKVFALGELVEEVKGKAKALRLAKKVAVKLNHESVFHLGELIKTKE
jgi:hypothetical protein